MATMLEKLNLKNESSIVVLNAPESFEPHLAGLEPVNVLRTLTPGTRVRFAIAFVVTQKELDEASEALAAGAEGDAIVWLAYPKKSSKKYRCEFNRDSGWNILGKAGFEGVRMVAIDDDWSALRFRRVEFIKTLTRSESFALSEGGKKRAAARASEETSEKASNQ